MERSFLAESGITKFIIIVILSVIVAVGCSRVTYAESDSGKEVSSFLQMEERVVEIINSSNLAGYSADVRTWRKNLDFLINNYDVIVNENDSDKEAIDRYVAEYSHVDELNEMPCSLSYYDSCWKNDRWRRPFGSAFFSHKQCETLCESRTMCWLYHLPGVLRMGGA